MYVKIPLKYEPYDDVFISGGTNEIICFDSLGVNYTDKVIKNLIAQTKENMIFKAKKEESKILKNDSHYAYTIGGQLLNRNYVKGFGFGFAIDGYLAKDLKKNDL